MFDELKKRLSKAVKGLIKKEEKEAESAETHIKESKPENIAERPRPEGHETNAQETDSKDARKDASDAAKQEVKKDREGDNRLIKLSLKTKVKGALLGTVRLNEAEVNDFLETLRISMLESDVSYETAEQFIEDLRPKLLEKEIDSKRIKHDITVLVRSSLLSILYPESGVDVYGFAERRKEENALPVRILFLGPNGAGKTTTIAKIAHHLKGMGISNVLSASDTFRAAAIEQIEHHAKKIGVPVIKSTYGADPASIAFDAIAYAKAHSMDIVLIDSAGRQETNKSLINEVQKMVRVSKPDLTIFVGESTAGNVIAKQIKEFNKFVKIDGIILTKLDCDAKGGGALSISHTTGIPILFFGIGEGYDALIRYDPDYIVNAILPEAG